MAGFEIKIDKEELENVKKTLAGIKNGYTSVVVRALNKTITGVQTDSVAEVSKIITPTKTAIRKTFKLKKANYRQVSAAVRSTGKPIPLINYKARQTAKKGVTVQIYKKGERESWPYSFIATMRSGHKGVFSREKPPYKTNKSKKLPWKRLSPKYRLPINEKFGPTIPDIMKRDSVMNPILQKASNRLTKEIDSSLKFELSKL